MSTTTITTMSALVSPSKDANLGFRFRQFFVRHDSSSMKVGTDGVLLGAWAPVNLRLDDLRFTILDVGTGCGLIALMLAQRCNEAQIDAIDIDEASCNQAGDNFAASPWAERLHVAHCSLQDWQMRKCENEEMGKCYDLIVSNPPYFVRSLKAPDAARCAARHNDTLPFNELIAASARLLKPNGTLALIVPCEAETELQALAAAQGLQCIRRCYVHPKPERPAKRVMIEWTNGEWTNGRTDERLTLEDVHGARSAEYQQLTKDFYL